MASGRKLKPINDLIMMRPGLRAQIPDSPSVSLASGSPRGAPHYLNAGYENTDNMKGSHDYEDLEYYNQIPAGPRKTDNAVYQQTTPSNLPPQHIKIERQRQFTECSDDSASSLMHTNQKDSWCNWVIHGLILAMSFAAVVLVILMAVGIIGPKSCCDNKPGKLLV
jgi:hypothetical protein